MRKSKRNQQAELEQQTTTIINVEQLIRRRKSLAKGMNTNENSD